MRRIHIVTVAGLILSVLLLAYSQTPPAMTRTDQTTTEAQRTQPVKPRKVLVKQLPKGLEGIVLEKGVFKLARGYKFVNQTVNSVAVALSVGGVVTGTFSCGCYREGTGRNPSGNCKVASDKDGRLLCIKDETNPCTALCFLEANINHNRSRLAIF